VGGTDIESYRFGLLDPRLKLGFREYGLSYLTPRTL
jgi:hypothetical protein